MRGEREGRKREGSGRREWFLVCLPSFLSHSRLYNVIQKWLLGILSESPSREGWRAGRAPLPACPSPIILAPSFSPLLSPLLNFPFFCRHCLCPFLFVFKITSYEKDEPGRPSTGGDTCMCPGDETASDSVCTASSTPSH